MEENENNRGNCSECGDSRFEVIARAKGDLFKSTNIESDEKEVAVIDNILFRCYQMGWLDRYEEEKHPNLKTFNLEQAKAGKPVCTRDGRKARIICFDRKNDSEPIVALIDNNGYESSFNYNVNGRYNVDVEHRLDLMMLSEKKEGWVNVYKERIYSTKEEAIEATYDGATYVDTVKISWEE